MFKFFCIYRFYHLKYQPSTKQWCPTFFCCLAAYHCKCVDKWLTSRSRTCPVCKFSITSDGGESGPEPSGVDGEQRSRRQRRRRRRRRSRPAARDDSDASEESDGEGAPLVTQLSSSSGEYGARGSSSVPSATVVMSPLRSRPITESNSESERERSHVVLVDGDEEQPLRSSRISEL